VVKIVCRDVALLRLLIPTVLSYTYYDWFIVIEPESGDYFIDPDENVARQKAREQFGDTMRLMMRINETGTCGKI
jgi:hypothetical protein